MVYINRLHYLAMELLSGMKVDSVIDWKLELALTRKRAQQRLHLTAVWAFCAGFVFGLLACLAVIGGR